MAPWIVGAGGSALASFTSSYQPCQVLAPEAGEMAVLARCDVEIAAGPVILQLRGAPPGRVRLAEFLKDGNATPVGVISLDVRTVVDPETVTVLVRDVNADGNADFAILDRSAPAEQGTWQFWLWRPSESGFAFHQGLSRLPNPELSRDGMLILSRRAQPGGAWITRRFRMDGERLVPVNRADDSNDG